MVSVIIPARNETFLQATIDNIVKNAIGNYEIVVGLDGYMPCPDLKPLPNLKIYHSPEGIGMRPMINTMVDMAEGEFIMKVDAHCAFSQGFDSVLSDCCKSDWVVVPRQYSLDVDMWYKNVQKPCVDYWYLSPPCGFRDSDQRPLGLHAIRWFERTSQNPIDDLMIFQGSCYFMRRDYFHTLSLMDVKKFGKFAYEGSEISLKTWLTGGRVVVNKNAWFAHLSKGKKYGRGYFLGKSSVTESAKAHYDWVINNSIEGAVHNLKWLINKFSPIPLWEDFDWGNYHG
ncbi:MAG TPA: glycosyltransferase family 2 protein [Desulfosporosinus sp.]|nr:glycosyltransferase family 2 protein [Desulfosporosinus sp.]